MAPRLIAGIEDEEDELTRAANTHESPLRIGERNATRTSFAVMKEKTIVARVKGECAR